MKKIFNIILLLCIILTSQSWANPSMRETIRSNALFFIGHNGPFKIQGQYFNYDCSGFVLAVFKKSKLSFFNTVHIRKGQNMVSAIYHFLRQKNKIYRAPQNIKIGDFIFFSNTYDANLNGLWDDTFTHIGLIIKVDSDGTITYIDKSGQGIKKHYMNLRFSHKSKHKNKILNSYLRKKKKTDKPYFKYLSGELFTCFGTY